MTNMMSRNGRQISRYSYIMIHMLNHNSKLNIVNTTDHDRVCEFYQIDRFLRGESNGASFVKFHGESRKISTL